MQLWARPAKAEAADTWLPLWVGRGSCVFPPVKRNLEVGTGKGHPTM